MVDGHATNTQHNAFSCRTDLKSTNFIRCCRCFLSNMRQQVGTGKREKKAGKGNTIFFRSKKKRGKRSSIFLFCFLLYFTSELGKYEIFDLMFDLPSRFEKSFQVLPGNGVELEGLNSQEKCSRLVLHMLKGQSSPCLDLKKGSIQWLT